MTFIRLPLILVGQFLMWAYYTGTHQSNPWMAAVGMTNFYLPLTADLGCVLLLVWLLQHEGMTFGDLIGLSRGGLVCDVLTGPGLFVVTLVLFQVTSLISSLLVHGPGIFTATSPSATQSEMPMPPL